MKKQLMYATLFMGVLSSCSNDSESISQPGVDPAGREVIQLAVGNGNGLSVTTRGTGMVGDTENAQWNGETLNIMMMTHGTLEYAADEDILGNKKVVMKNVELTAPVGNGTGFVTGAASQDKQYFYYPTVGNFDFYGYHVDDAKLSDEPYVLEADNRLMVVDFDINGSQDLMTAKADFTADSLKAQEAAAPNYYDWNVEQHKVRKYSAFAARRGTQPTLVFNHWLTKLNFKILIPESEAPVIDEENGINTTIYVDSLSLKAIHKGQLVVANTAGEPGQIMWNETDTTTMWLMEKAEGETYLQTLSTQALSTEVLDLGAGVMLAPAAEYKATIYIHQTPEGRTEAITKPIQMTIKLPANAASAMFAAGTAYDVIVTVYGLQEIQVTTELTNWVDGGDIEITPEDEI